MCDVSPSPRMPSHRLRFAPAPLLVASGLTDRFSSSMVLFCLAGLETLLGPYSARNGCRAPGRTILLYSPSGTLRVRGFAPPCLFYAL